MNDFICKFKETSYYKELFEVDEEILLIYLGGSRCFNTFNEFSDYDVTIMTLNGDFKDMHLQYYLRYGTKKVHCYYCPLWWFFDANYERIYEYIGAMILGNISEDILIYKNSKYDNLIKELSVIGKKLWQPVCYRLFDFSKDLVEKILNKGYVLEEDIKKNLYYLCLASYLICNEPLELGFLRALNLGCRTGKILEEYRQKAFDRVAFYKKYIEQNPLEINNILNNLHKQLEYRLENYYDIK